MGGIGALGYGKDDAISPCGRAAPVAGVVQAGERRFVQIVHLKTAQNPSCTLRGVFRGRGGVNPALRGCSGDFDGR